MEQDASIGKESFSMAGESISHASGDATLSEMLPIQSVRAVKDAVLSHSDLLPSLLVIGVGGQGNNALMYIQEMNLPQVELLGINTDIKDLGKLHDRGIPTLQIGADFLNSNGAGGDPLNGENAMKGAAEELRVLLQERMAREKNRLGLVFILAGLGGGTGTGSVPVIAQICSELSVESVGGVVESTGVPMLAILTLPRFEDGPRKREHTVRALELLEPYSIGVIPLNNDVLQSCSDLSIDEEYEIIDSKVANMVQSLVEIIVSDPRENSDLNDFVKFFLSGDSVEDVRSKLLLMGMSDLQISPELLDGESELTEHQELNGAIKKELEKAVDQALLSDTQLHNNIKGVQTVLFQMQASQSTKNLTKKITYLKQYICKIAGMRFGSIDFYPSRGINEKLEPNTMRINLMATNFPHLTPLRIYQQAIDAVVESMSREDVESQEASIKAAPLYKRGKRQYEWTSSSQDTTHPVSDAYKNLKGKVSFSKSSLPQNMQVAAEEAGTVIAVEPSTEQKPSLFNSVKEEPPLKEELGIGKILNGGELSSDGK